MFNSLLYRVPDYFQRLTASTRFLMGFFGSSVGFTPDPSPLWSFCAALYLPRLTRLPNTDVVPKVAGLVTDFVSKNTKLKCFRSGAFHITLLSKTSETKINVKISFIW